MESIVRSLQAISVLDAAPLVVFFLVLLPFLLGKRREELEFRTYWGGLGASLGGLKLSRSLSLLVWLTVLVVLTSVTIAAAGGASADKKEPAKPATETTLEGKLTVKLKEMTDIINELTEQRADEEALKRKLAEDLCVLKKSTGEMKTALNKIDDQLDGMLKALAPKQPEKKSSDASAQSNPNGAGAGASDSGQDK